MADWETMKALVQKGDRKGTVDMVKKALDEGLDPETILDNGLIAAMKIVGDRFARNEIFVPEMLIAARAMQAALDVLEPLLVNTGAKERGWLVAGTVRGDLHDIGKNLVIIMLKGVGWKVEDLGVDCNIDKYFEAAERVGSKAVLCSALLTTTMPYMKKVVHAVKEHGKDLKVIIGGAPVTQAYADEIGADGYGKNAAEGVKVVDALLGE